MRAFGILLVLGTLVAIVVIMAAPGGCLDYVRQVKKSGDWAEGHARQWAGVDKSGARASDSVTFDPVEQNGVLRGLKVTTITPGGPMQTYFGLAKDDLITGIGPQTTRDIDDAGLAEALAVEAYQRQWELVIRRGDQEFSLPRDRAAADKALIPVAGAPGAVPGAPTNGPAGGTP